MEKPVHFCTDRLLPSDQMRFQSTVRRGGSHVIDTRGPTDVVMRLFGPDSQTNVIAENDDSGAGTNASIAASLVPGLYYAQVHPYNRAGGKGDYTIRVRRT